MSWQTILLSIIGIVLTTLVTWAMERLIALINSKLGDSKYKKQLEDAVSAVTKAVKITFQTYVEALKGQDMFTQNAQAEALNKAKDVAIEELSTETQSFIESNFGDVEKWIASTIESVIYDLKNK